MILVIVSINRVYSTKKETADLVTFTEEILSGKLHFLWSGLLMVSPFLYKPKGESVSTRWGHLIFWQRSEALFIKEANTDYHFKQNKNKMKKNFNNGQPATLRQWNNVHFVKKIRLRKWEHCHNSYT